MIFRGFLSFFFFLTRSHVARLALGLLRVTLNPGFSSLLAAQYKGYSVAPYSSLLGDTNLMVERKRTRGRTGEIQEEHRRSIGGGQEEHRRRTGGGLEEDGRNMGGAQGEHRRSTGAQEEDRRSTGGAQLLQSQGRRKQSKNVQPLQESFLPTSTRLTAAEL